MTICKVLCCCGLLAAAPLAMRDATAQEPGAVTGQVLASDSTPVAAADVGLVATTLATLTDSLGRFRISGVPVGSYQLRVLRLGFTTQTLPVTVTAGETLDLRIVVSRSALEVAGVTVIGTKEDLDETRQRLRLVPGSVALVAAADLRATRLANLQDALRLTPGVFVQPRFGAADESQLSIRGSGLRNNFHLRGVNLLVNGMPYRNADGFTDFESLELLTTEAIEVHKGGNALRYGGSTLGGAINLVTKTGYTAGRFEGFGEGGSFGFAKAQLASGGTRRSFDYYASFAHTSLAGYRDWSDQRRDRLNLHGGWVLSPGVDLRTFYFFAHVQEHLPGALSPAAFAVDPRQADSVNEANRWGRDYALHHVGVQLRAQLSPRQRIEIAPYFQYRDIDHPIFRVIAQVSRDWGAEIRYENTVPFAGLRNRLTLGVQPVYGNVDDRQYDNVAGAHGTLRKDQRDVASGTAAYLEDVLSVSSRLSTVVGLRWERAERRVRDFFLGDGDQTDTKTYRTLAPKFGVLYDVSGSGGGGTQLYSNVSRSFEPPLLLELNSLTGPGFIDLAGQSAWQFEMGSRGHLGRLDWDVAAYDIELRDEILNSNVPPFPGAPFTVPTYRNAPRTRHYGLETGLTYTVGDRLRLRGAYTFARYRYVEDSSYAGNEIPGAPRHLVQAELRYTDPVGLSITPSVEWVPQPYFVNSTNTERNRKRTVFGVRAEWTAPRGGGGVTAFVAIQNLTNVRYAGSVQVDNAAGKFLEPADGRSVYGGLRWQP